MSKEHNKMEESHFFPNFQSFQQQRKFQETVGLSRTDSLSLSRAFLRICNRFLANQEFTRRAEEGHTSLERLIDAAQSRQTRDISLLHDAELQQSQSSTHDSPHRYSEESRGKHGEVQKFHNSHSDHAPCFSDVDEEFQSTSKRSLQHSDILGGLKRIIPSGSYTRAQFLQSETEEFNQFLEDMEYYSREREVKGLARTDILPGLELT